MKQIELTKGCSTIVGNEDHKYLRQFNWRCNNGYAARNIKINGKQKMILMHRIIMNTPEGMETDHINGDRLDNRKENLRICTHKQNMQNRKINKNNTTGYRGVNPLVIKCKNKDGILKKYKYIQAQIRFGNKKINLGYFPTLELAAEAYNKAAIKYHGEFAQLNEV